MDIYKSCGNEGKSTNKFNYYYIITLLMEPKQLEDLLASSNFSDKAIVLAVASWSGGQEIRKNIEITGWEQTIKEDGSTISELDELSGKAIVLYVNDQTSLDTQFKSEEKMPFMQIVDPDYYGIFDDLDGSVHPLVGGTNLHYIGVGGVIHQKENDEQIAAAGYLPVGEPQMVYLAEKGKGVYAIDTAKSLLTKIELSREIAQKNITIESGMSSPATNKAEQKLYENGFYDILGIGPRDRVNAGIFQAISGIRDNRQIVLNNSASHQADFCYLLLSEAGAEVIGQNGDPMYSTSNAMLSIAPSCSADREQLKEKFVEAYRDYKGWSPLEVPLSPVCPQ